MANQYTNQPLTAMQERFAQNLASGLNHTDAYRQAGYGGDSSPTTINTSASDLAAHPQIVPRVEAIQQAAQAQNGNLQQQIVDKLTHIALANTLEPVKASDQVQAIDKLAKMLGLYQERDPNAKPVQVTRITVRLEGKTETVVVEALQATELPDG